MKKLLLVITAFLTLTGLYAQNNNAKFKGWKKTKTKHFTFVYEEASREAAERFVKIADEAWIKVSQVYSMPRENITVYVTGRTNTVNAFTYGAPLEIGMFTNPCTIKDFPFRDNWQELFFTHELIHAANFQLEDKGTVEELLMGEFAKNLDFAEVPAWALEGLAVVLETEIKNGGRGRSPYFELGIKSLTMDNSFVAYEDIGLERQPPYGQAYVMGYMIMQSIADRFGYNALADIERNRKFGTSWEDAVKLVTGVSAQDLYRDAKIALAKKYADERKIPEGIIISPRKINTNYLKPSIIFDDGSFIALRTSRGTDAAVVKFDPSAKSGSNSYLDTKPEEDLNTLFKETVLFTGSFVDEESVAADENGNVYAVLGIVSYDKIPGATVETALYSWNKEKGLKRLTKKVSLFHPSVSRDGKVLVAVEQKGMQMRLVKVDTETGKVTPLLEDENLSFIQPNVNADGSKVTCLAFNNERAQIIILDLNNNSYEIVANDDEEIFDPSYPMWNSDGLVTYSCNYRGRLESFEVSKSEDGEWVSIPVVSDPIGVTWSYKNELGIFYGSEAASGSVVKMKPLSEWGVVPDFEGPTASGEKITFGNLETDYPDFKPFTVLSEVEEPEKSKEEQKAEKKQEIKVLLKKNSENAEPIPVKGKTVKHRSEENIKKAAETTEVITEIENEKPYIGMIRPIFYLPMVDVIQNHETESTEFGYGFVFEGETPRLQLSTGVVLFDAFYYPTMNNFSFDGIMALPLGPVKLDLLGRRFIGSYLLDSEPDFKEVNRAGLSFEVPLVHKVQHRNEIDVTLLAGGIYSLIRTSPVPCSINGNFESAQRIRFQGGLELYYNKEMPKHNDISLDLTALGLGLYLFEQQPLYFGCEGEAAATCRIDFLKYELFARARYTPYPEGITDLDESRVTFGGRNLDCEYAGRIVPGVSIITQDIMNDYFFTRTYAELLMSFNESELVLSDEYVLGMETVCKIGRSEAALGVSLKTNFKDEIDFNDWNDTFVYYFTYKLGNLRH